MDKFLEIEVKTMEQSEDYFQEQTYDETSMYIAKRGSTLGNK